jgi:PAS domain S-box-containing protein
VNRNQSPNGSVVLRTAAQLTLVAPIVWTTRPDGYTEYLTERSSEWVRLAGGEDRAWGWLRLIHPDDHDRAYDVWKHAVGAGTPLNVECRLRRPGLNYRWMDVRGVPERAIDGRILRWTGTCADIEAQEQLLGRLRDAEREAAESAIFLEALQSTAPVGFAFVSREFRYLRVNEMLAAINGVSVEQHVGRLVSEVVPELWAQIEPFYRHVLETNEAVVNIETVGQTAAAPGQVRSWLTSYYPIRMNGEVSGIGVVVVDVTERRAVENLQAAVMANMAEGVYAVDAEGRLTFMNAAASKMLGWSEDELRGREMHDAIHSQHADGTPFPEDECPLLKALIAGRTLRVADDAFTRKDGSIVHVAYSAAPLLNGSRVSGVVAVFRDTTDDKAQLADAQRELDTLTWIGRIREALNEDRLVLYSQPIIPLTGGERSEELLLRMVGRDGEIILPGSFLPVAEKFDLIGEIDEWVIKQAIRVAADGRFVEANLSAASISTHDLLPLIERELRSTGADPSQVVFELTETALMRDVEAGQAFARGVTEIGCGLALDDFGTGFGSFTYLKKLPIKYLKIDMEFVRELTSSRANQHVVKAIVSLARAFGQQTIAEGVEDSETVALLAQYGVDFAQGFHFGRPKALSTD